MLPDILSNVSSQGQCTGAHKPPNDSFIPPPTPQRFCGAQSYALRGGACGRGPRGFPSPAAHRRLTVWKATPPSCMSAQQIVPEPSGQQDLYSAFVRALSSKPPLNFPQSFQEKTADKVRTPHGPGRLAWYFRPCADSDREPVGTDIRPHPQSTLSGKAWVWVSG